MAQQNSFDITTGVDLQEVDNAINQAQKEIAQRYDFKDSKATIDFQRGEGRSSSPPTVSFACARSSTSCRRSSSSVACR